MERGTEAQRVVWEGAIPLQVHLHESEVTTLPPPSPVMILAPRIGYLPLLVNQLKPLFSSALPPGSDTVWFDYKGLPLKWYIPTGVLFDLLCAEPERPWNLMVHFRGYPGNILTPCDGEDAVKWSFINSLKEAAYVINGNCKNIMNMSQSDQIELWKSICSSNLEAFLRVSSKLRLGAVEDEYTLKLNPSLKSRFNQGITDNSGAAKTGRIPIRLCVRMLDEEFDDLEDVSDVDSWERILYINRPVDVPKDASKYFSLKEAIRSLLPEYFRDKLPENIEKGSNEEIEKITQPEDSVSIGNKEEESSGVSDPKESGHPSKNFEIKLLRIQGIEPKLDIPFSWVVNNLMNPDHFVHICLYIKSSL